MSLKNIRASVASELGFHPDTSTEDKSYLDAQINQIALDIFNEHDLVGSLFETIGFLTDYTEKLISLPSYVGDVRGIRYYGTPYFQTLRDIRPRYGTEGWGFQLFDFREIGTSTLWVDNNEWSSLVFSLPEGEVSEKNITISIVGATPLASQVEEKLTLATGQNSVTSVNNWIETPRVIEKNAPNNFDILVSDINGIELALIPNSELKSLYSIWQVMDDSFISITSAQSFEVLYKERYKLLVNDYDEFLTGKYDEVIIWKFLAEYWGKQEGKETLAENAVIAYNMKMSNVNKNKAKGKKVELQTVPNKFYGLFNKPYYRAGRIGYN